MVLIGRFSEFVLPRLEQAVNQKDKKRVKCLLYAQYLLWFRSLKDSQLSRREQISEHLGDIPSVVVNRLYTLFTQSQDGPTPDIKKYLFTCDETY